MSLIRIEKEDFTKNGKRENLNSSCIRIEN
jgi:hypothetical protein